jgi:hypothetical protein
MYATTESQRKSSAKYRMKNKEKYAEYKRNFYHNNKDYVERERIRLKTRYDAKKNLNVLTRLIYRNTNLRLTI